MISTIFLVFLSKNMFRSSIHTVFNKDLDSNLPVRNRMANRRRISKHIESMAAVGCDGVKRGMADCKPAISIFYSQFIEYFNFSIANVCDLV